MSEKIKLNKKQKFGDWLYSVIVPIMLIFYIDYAIFYPNGNPNYVFNKFWIHHNSAMLFVGILVFIWKRKTPYLNYLLIYAIALLNIGSINIYAAILLYPLGIILLLIGNLVGYNLSKIIDKCKYKLFLSASFKNKIIIINNNIIVKILRNNVFILFIFGAWIYSFLYYFCTYLNRNTINNQFELIFYTSYILFGLLLGTSLRKTPVLLATVFYILLMRKYCIITLNENLSFNIIFFGFLFYAVYGYVYFIIACISGNKIRKKLISIFKINN